jgi:hypothetical protein
MPPLELSVNTELLKTYKVFVATPMYGGAAHGLYVKSSLDLQTMFNQLQIECKFSFLFNESLITRARNYLVDEFLRSNYTHLLFIDSDIEFRNQDVLALLALNRDVIGGPYPKKSIHWNNVFMAAKNNSNNTQFNPGDLEKVTGDYVFNPVPGTEKFSVYEPLDVLEIGTGFMMIKREVFDKYKQAYPHLTYKPDHVGQQHFDGSRYIHAYFDTVIDPVSHRYLSEDYMFCQNWRNMGGKVWLCPWMETKHIGTYPFTGNLPAVAALTGKL